MGDKAKRTSKTSRAQYELYINELRVNQAFRENKFDGSDPEIIQRSWKDLSEKLNASGGGPVKDVVGWKRVFTDWKSQTRAKARKLRSVALETGNVGEPSKPLTDLEAQLLDITGRVVIDGMANVPELGIDELKRPGPEQGQQTVLSTLKDSLKNEKSPSQTPKRKRSFAGYLETLTGQPTAVTANEKAVSVLSEINSNIRRLVKVGNKRLKLKKLKLQVQYPEYTFILTSSDDSE